MWVNQKMTKSVVYFMKYILRNFWNTQKNYDFIEGFEDFRKYNRLNKSANSLIMLMAREIFSCENFQQHIFLHIFE